MQNVCIIRPSSTACHLITCTRLWWWRRRHRVSPSVCIWSNYRDNGIFQILPKDVLPRSGREQAQRHGTAILPTHNVGADSRKSRWKLFRLVVCTDDEDRSPEPFTSLTMRSMSSCFMALGWRRATSVLPPGFRTNLCSTSSAGECGC